MRNFTAVLFDLDGTLVDTAPDLAFALNTLLIERDKSALEYDIVRPVASHGAAGLLDLGFGISESHPLFSELKTRLISIYQKNISRKSTLFDGMEEVLTSLEKANITWGIVTNKPAFLTMPLLKALHLSDRASCIVSGDTTAYSKPHIAPMLHACRLIGHQAEECLYIGDALRDIEAGKNAHMQTVAALYGYIGADDKPEQWQADHLINHPLDILKWIQ